MSTTLTVLALLVSAAFGFAGGLLTPWIKWLVEKRQERLAYRRSEVAAWREALDREDFEFAVPRSDFLSTSTYSSLRVHLSKETIRVVEDSRGLYGAGRGGPHRRDLLLDEVARIEREWGLV